MLDLQSIFTATLLLLVTTFSAQAQVTTLDSLPEATQDEISRICLPVQFRDGAGAYRNCIQAEIELRASGRTTDLGELSFDDKYAVQQACANSGEQFTDNYLSCVSNQINELNQIAAPSFDQLSEDELYVVQQSCFNAQSKQGAASYRQCLNNEVQSLSAIPAADTSKLNMLNKNALQLRCSSNATNAVQYRQCVADQFESIAGTEPEFIPTGSLANVASQIATPSNNSSSITETANPVTVNDVAVLSSEPANVEPIVSMPRNITPPPSTRELSEPTTVAPEAESNIPAEPQTAEETTQETAEETEETAETAETAETLLAGDSPLVNTLPETTDIAAIADTNVNTNTQNDSSTAESRVISRPKLVETLELQARTNTEGVELDPGVGADPAATVAASPQNMFTLQKVEELWQTFLNKLSSMDAIGWLLIAAMLALPALLLGFFSMIRGLRRSPPPAMPEYATAYNYRAETQPGSRRARHEQDAAMLFDDEMDSMAFNEQHDAVTRIASKSDLQLASQHLRDSANQGSARFEDSFGATDNQLSANGSSARQSVRTGVDWQSAFGSWLLEQPEANRLEACIEFLVYWLAYGDDRYQPELKQRLFTDTDLSSHDQIKRWVLKQDVLAFSDVVGWLRTNATQKQLDQSLALLMALLITEHSITPVQNTLLRFLSDAFNIGKKEIEQRFEKAFDHPMPPVPRTDKYAWWAKQKPEFMQRWEARFMATRSENEQMIARLGLTSDYDEAQIINSFRRAARRCHPDRFTELGERERILAEQQFIKFEQARDKLLGVSV